MPASKVKRVRYLRSCKLLQPHKVWSTYYYTAIQGGS